MPHCFFTSLPSGPRAAQQKHLLVLKAVNPLGVPGLYLTQKEKWILTLKLVIEHQTFCSLHLAIYEKLMLASHYWGNNLVPCRLAPRAPSPPSLQHRAGFPGWGLGTETPSGVRVFFFFFLLPPVGKLGCGLAGLRGGGEGVSSSDLKTRREGDD